MSDVSAGQGATVPAGALADPAAALGGSLQSLGLRLTSGAEVTDAGVQGDFEGTLFGLLPCRGRVLGGTPGAAEGLRAEVHLTGGTAELEREAGRQLQAEAERVRREVAALEQQAEAARTTRAQRVEQEAARLHAEGERMRRERDTRRREAKDALDRARDRLGGVEKELSEARADVERRRARMAKDVEEQKRTLAELVERREALEREVEDLRRPTKRMDRIVRGTQAQMELVSLLPTIKTAEEKLKRAGETREPLDDTDAKVAKALQRLETERAAVQAAEEAAKAAENPADLPEWAAKPEKVQAEAERAVGGAEADELAGRAEAVRRERGRLVGLAERLAAAPDAKPLEIRDITFETRLDAGMSPRVPGRIKAAVLQADGQRAEREVEVELNLAYLPEAAGVLAQRLAA